MKILSVIVSNHLIIKGSENKHSQLYRKIAEVLLLKTVTFKIYETLNHHQLIINIPTGNEFLCFNDQEMFPARTIFALL